MALTDNGNEMVMPVSPMMNSNNGFGWGDGSFWIIILFLFAFSPEDLTIIDKAVDVMLDFINYEKCMMEEDGNSYDEYSTRRGRSMTTGRYMSRDTMPMSMGRSMEQYSGRRSYNGGYSGHFRDKLEMLYNEAQNEDERRMVEEMMNRY